MKYTGQKYIQGIVIQRSSDGSAFQEKKIVNATESGTITPSVSGGFKEVVVNGGPGPQPSVPTIELLELYDINDELIDLLYEGEGPIMVKSIKHRETNLNNIDGTLTFYGGTPYISVLDNIEPSIEVATVELLPTVQVDTTTSFKLAGVAKDETPFAKEIVLVFENYVYTAISDTGEAPVEGLYKQGRADLFAVTGAEFTYDTGDSIYFYTVKNNAVVEQYILGTWTQVAANNLGQIEVTIDEEQKEFYCYQVGPFLSGGTDTFRIR